jgi:hypothetical protein
MATIVAALPRALSYPFLRCPTGRAPLAQAVVAINARLKAFADREPNVKYFDLTSHLCNSDGCLVFDSDGSPLYYDPNHLSMPGSWRVGRDVLLQQHGVPEAFSAIPLWSQAHRSDTTVSAIEEMHSKGAKNHYF